MQNEEEYQNKPQLYVVIEQEILCRKDLSNTAKLVYARMSGFQEFWESPEKTGEFIGKSKGTIIHARQELEAKGLIKCVRNTGRGKAYCIVRLHENIQSDYTKSSSQTIRNCIAYNKEENKVESISNKLDIVTTPPETYGNQEINEAFERFKEIFGYEMKQTQANRRAVYNFIRAKNKGSAWLEKMMILWYNSREDKFSPRISDFTDLQAKQNALMEWAQRKAISKTKVEEYVI